MRFDNTINCVVFCINKKIGIITVCNEVAKVMFLRLYISHSVHRGGSASVHAGIPPLQEQPSALPLGAGTPAPQEQTPPRSRHPREQVPPRADTPQIRHTSPQTATVADGTHPTGMHSCSQLCITISFQSVRKLYFRFLDFIGPVHFKWYI